MPVKRQRDPLSPIAHEKRNRSEVPPKNWLLTTRARDDSVDTYISNTSKAKHAVSIRNQPIIENIADEEAENIAVLQNHQPHRMKKHTLYDRKYAIKYMYEHVYGSPPVNGHVIAAIMAKLEIPGGSFGSVRTVLQEVSTAAQNNDIYNPKKGESARGRKSILHDDCPEAELIFRALETNISTMNVAVIVNEFRAVQNPPKSPVSFSAVERFVLRSNIINRTRRHTKKTGNTDAESTWAKARLAQCVQFLEQFRLGHLPDGHPDLQQPAYPPVKLHALVIFDENHKKCILGHSSKFENRIHRNDYDNAPTDPKFGGKLPPKKDRTKPKYEKEARGCFGVAMKLQPDGTKIGVKTGVFNYTERKVVGMKAYNTAVRAELRRVLPLKGVWKNDGYGYQQRYPDTWEAEVRKVVDKKLCSVKGIIDFMVRESDKIYAGTPYANSYFMYHDALSQFWEGEAVAYMKEIGMHNRLLRCTGETNRGTRYFEKVVGDSPELCRGLDAHGFSDHKLSMGFHTSLTSLYATNNELRFKTGTPTEMFSTMQRCWTVEPKSDRIVEDISAFPDILEKVIASRGTVLHGCDLRHGRRYERHDHKGELKAKPRGRQRKDTMIGRPVHQDAMAAYNQLIGVAGPLAEENYLEDLMDDFLHANLDGEDDFDTENEESEVSEDEDNDE